MGSLVSLGDYAAYGTLGSYGFFRGGFLKGRVAQLRSCGAISDAPDGSLRAGKGRCHVLADDLTRAIRPRILLS
jgi:hypothetical protein